jgi:hypothetical protein
MLIAEEPALRAIRFANDDMSYGLETGSFQASKNASTLVQP